MIGEYTVTSNFYWRGELVKKGELIEASTKKEGKWLIDANVASKSIIVDTADLLLNNVNNDQTDIDEKDDDSKEGKWLIDANVASKSIIVDNADLLLNNVNNDQTDIDEKDDDSKDEKKKQG